jgi:hypothetical protein
MDLSVIEKATYYFNYLYDTYYLKLYPYKNVIIDNSPSDVDHKRMNYINWGYKMSLNFQESKRVVVNYSGDIKFNTVLYAHSHNEINRKVNKILENNLDKKIKCKFPNIIVHVVFLLYTDESIDILNIINNSVECENNNITFNDILFLCNLSAQNIKSINVSFVKKMKTFKKEFNFEDYQYRDIGILNSVFD